MDVHLNRHSSTELTSFSPVISKCIGKELSISSEASSCNWHVASICGLYSLLLQFVPEKVLSVSSICCKSSVLAVEGNSVEMVDISFVISMAFEAEIVSLLLPSLVDVNIFDATSSFNWTHCKSISFREAFQCSSLVLQRRLKSLFVRSRTAHFCYFIKVIIDKVSIW